MIEYMQINRKEFLCVCKSLYAAQRLRGGPYTVTLRFEPGEMHLEADWGHGVVATDGKEKAMGLIAYSHIQRLIANQKLKSSRKEKLTCVLAPGHKKVLIESGVLGMNFIYP